VQDRYLLMQEATFQSNQERNCMFTLQSATAQEKTLSNFECASQIDICRCKKLLFSLTKKKEIECLHCMMDLQYNAKYVTKM
jgi:hypothetical protein